ncbi:hypothetical protein IW256_001324 [Actinomadura viridis]|uniref:Uncharacterized protein n=1 Tax=Actinomadura viridis TaxID=58110 RepID=A0A931DGN9_9ACTN|nr:hypothetical protein [Actinomadura viridis]
MGGGGRDGRPRCVGEFVPCPPPAARDGRIAVLGQGRPASDISDRMWPSVILERPGRIDTCMRSPCQRATVRRDREGGAGLSRARGPQIDGSPSSPGSGRVPGRGNVRPGSDRSVWYGVTLGHVAGRLWKGVLPARHGAQRAGGHGAARTPAPAGCNYSVKASSAVSADTGRGRAAVAGEPVVPTRSRSTSPRPPVPPGRPVPGREIGHSAAPGRRKRRSVADGSMKCYTTLLSRAWRGGYGQFRFIRIRVVCAFGCITESHERGNGA